MTKGMFALLLAGALMVPHVTPALGTDSTLGLGHARPRKEMAGTCSFRPSRYLDTLRWLHTGARGPKVDILMVQSLIR